MPLPGAEPQKPRAASKLEQKVIVTLGRVTAQQLLRELKQGRLQKRNTHAEDDLLDQLDAEIKKLDAK